MLSLVVTELRARAFIGTLTSTNDVTAPTQQLRWKSASQPGPWGMARETYIL